MRPFLESGGLRHHPIDFAEGEPAAGLVKEREGGLECGGLECHCARVEVVDLESGDGHLSGLYLLSSTSRIAGSLNPHLHRNPSQESAPPFRQPQLWQ